METAAATIHMVTRTHFFLSFFSFFFFSFFLLSAVIYEFLDLVFLITVKYSEMWQCWYHISYPTQLAIRCQISFPSNLIYMIFLGKPQTRKPYTGICFFYHVFCNEDVHAYVNLGSEKFGHTHFLPLQISCTCHGLLEQTRIWLQQSIKLWQEVDS